MRKAKSCGRKSSPEGRTKVAVFLDRDGTICEEVGYIHSKDQLRLIPGAAEAIRRLNRRGIKTVVITNQSGVARGFFSEEQLRAIHEEFLHLLREEGARLDGIYYCPHHPTEGQEPYLRVCECRKPSPGLLKKAAEELDIDLEASFMVGDHFADVAAGLAVGGKGILVLTGHGEKTLGEKATWTVSPSWIAQDLAAAVDWILSVLEEP